MKLAVDRLLVGKDRLDLRENPPPRFG